MSRYLWRYYLEDDVDRFRQLLQDGGVASRVEGRKAGNTAPSFGSFGTTSPTSSYKIRAVAEKEIDPSLLEEGASIPLTRADINARDGKGLTLLHHAASSVAENSNEFALALISHPLVDLYLQDYENGWTVLHRAFYFGNITIARAILERDDPGQGGSGVVFSQVYSLIKVKDREGHGPFDLLFTTIADRSLRPRDLSWASDDTSSSNGGNDAANRSPDRGDESAMLESMVLPSVNVRADELFTFGSNKNFSLGFGDQDDRQYPEHMSLKRPKRLFQRFYREHITRQAAMAANVNSVYADKLRAQLNIPQDVSDLPDVIRMKPLYIQDVQMAKFHTVALTTDPITNIYVCGHGVGGRLGTGNEKTLFNFTCLDEFGSARIASIALGQDHTLAVTDKGELYSWGSNVYGQLGCGLPRENPKPEDTMQLSPKQIFGPMKKEVIVGVAASRIHSVAHTGNALFTFGKNEGQLGLVDSQAGTLKVQSTPRQVYASRLSSSISAVSAIDRATVILLENREVHVFANYGAVKLQFPLDGFSNYFLRQSFLATKYNKTPNKIRKITTGGETICALSTSGEVFTVTVNQRLDPRASGNASTTNPNKIKAALSTPHRAWNLKSERMAARDVDVDADGSIILATDAGGVFRRVRRPKTGSAGAQTRREQKSKEFKFLRVPNLTRAVAVRASASGAYCALREDCNVTGTELDGPPKSLWEDIFDLLSFKSLSSESPAPSFWQRPDAVKRLVERIAQTKDVEMEVMTALRQNQAHFQSCDIALSSTASEFSIPAHQVILAGRSPVLRGALAIYHNQGTSSSDAFSILAGGQGKLVLRFNGLDFLTLFEMVLYMYADALVGFWRLRHNSPEMTFRYKQVRAELMKVGSRLELKNLEAAARKVITRPEPSMAADFELALLDPAFYVNCDARVQLADGELLVHSEFVSKRCPFFKGLFQGYAGRGSWLSARREGVDPSTDAVEVDLSHVELKTFKLVLRYIYADAGQEIFDNVVTPDVDSFLDVVMEVLSAANELMLDNLSRTCQVVLGRYVTTRNACQLLNAVAPSSIRDFKNVTLEYLCLSLEPVLANHWLDELEEDLLHELDQVVQENQCAAMPFVRSGRVDALLHENHPELAEAIARARQAKLDALDLKAKFPDALGPPSTSASKSRRSPVTVAKTQSTHGSPLSNAKSSVSTDAIAQGLEPLPSPAQSVSLRTDAVDITESSIQSSTSAVSRPWGPSPLSGAKLGLKDIMAQASFSQPSGLSLGLQSKSKTERQVSGPAATKISQKERKRQQQDQQQQKQQTESGHKLSTSPTETASSPASTSPWKNVGSTGKTTSPQPSSSPIITPSKASPSSTRASNTPQLTMRQTIANAPASKEKDAQSQFAKGSPQAPRSVSAPQPSEVHNLNKTSTPTKEPSGIQIQSIRHQPRQDFSQSPYQRQSLSDIMSREQAEKTTFKDAVAKRSLQEIQEEQAFQEWWDKESQAVQEAQRRTENAGSSRGRGNGRGRGRSRGRKGKQRADTDAEPSNRSS